jgi:phosphoribosylanthranilate isomerase
VALAKICGLSTPESVAAALAGGAAFLGFAMVRASPRFVTPQAAAALAAPARGKAKIVALAADPDDEAIDRILTGFQPDLVQLHGKESPGRTAEIARRAPVIKALGVAETADVEAGRDYDGLVAHLMFDARPPPGASRAGGHGAAFDWSLLAGRRWARPWFLAGGLDPWNVEEAARVSGAPMVDVSSGVERGPGLKDAALMASFLSAAARA